MSWIEKIRKKPQAEKIRLMWAIIAAVAALLVVVWIFTSKIASNASKGRTVFEKINKEMSGIREYFKK